MAFASTYPAVKAALIAAWDAAMQVPVIPGPVVGTGTDGVLTVGYQDDNNPSAMQGVMTRATYGHIPERETYTINCAVAVTSGSTNIAAAEAAVLALFAQAGAVLEGNFTAGGAMTIGIDTFELLLMQAADGATAIIKFGVAVDAFTTV